MGVKIQSRRYFLSFPRTRDHDGDSDILVDGSDLPRCFYTSDARCVPCKDLVSLSASTLFCHVSQLTSPCLPYSGSCTRQPSYVGRRRNMPVPPISWHPHNPSSTRVCAVARQALCIRPSWYPSRTDYPTFDYVVRTTESRSLDSPAVRYRRPHQPPSDSSTSPSFSRPSNLQSTGNPSYRAILSLFTNLTDAWMQSS